MKELTIYFVRKLWPDIVAKGLSTAEAIAAIRWQQTIITTQDNRAWNRAKGFWQILVVMDAINGLYRYAEEALVVQPNDFEVYQILDMVKDAINEMDQELERKEKAA